MFFNQVIYFIYDSFHFKDNKRRNGADTSAHVSQRKGHRGGFSMHFRFKCLSMTNRCPWDFKIPGKCAVNLLRQQPFYGNIKSIYKPSYQRAQTTFKIKIPRAEFVFCQRTRAHGCPFRVMTHCPCPARGAENDGGGQAATLKAN